MTKAQNTLESLEDFHRDWEAHQRQLFGGLPPTPNVTQGPTYKKFLWHDQFLKRMMSTLSKPAKDYVMSTNDDLLRRETLLRFKRRYPNITDEELFHKVWTKLEQSGYQWVDLYEFEDDPKMYNQLLQQYYGKKASDLAFIHIIKSGKRWHGGFEPYPNY